MPHITLDIIAKGLIDVLPANQLTSIIKLLTTVSQATAVASLKPLIEQRVGLPSNESRAISKRIIKILKAEIRDNLSS